MRRAKKARNFVANGLSFKSNWLRRWRKFSRPIYYNAKYSSHNWKYSNRPLPTWFLHFFWIELLRWLPQVVYSIYCVKKVWQSSTVRTTRNWQKSWETRTWHSASNTGGYTTSVLPSKYTPDKLLKRIQEIWRDQALQHPPENTKLDRNLIFM